VDRSDFDNVDSGRDLVVPRTHVGAAARRVAALVRRGLHLADDLDSDWLTVVCGKDGAMALRRDGTLWAWGRNDHFQLGLGDTVDRHRPTRVGTDDDWQTVACHWYYSVAVKRDSTLWTWGSADGGQLGLDVVSSATSPFCVVVGCLRLYSAAHEGQRPTSPELGRTYRSPHMQIFLTTLHDPETSPVRSGLVPCRLRHRCR